MSLSAKWIFTKIPPEQIWMEAKKAAAITLANKIKIYAYSSPFLKGDKPFKSSASADIIYDKQHPFFKFLKENNIGHSNPLYAFGKYNLGWSIAYAEIFVDGDKYARISEYTLQKKATSVFKDVVESYGVGS